MKCPIDQTTLTIADRQGIEIDYCPECRGVWLDRGELDKLIERSNLGVSSAPRPAERYEKPREERYESRERHHDDDYNSHGKHHKRESFLGDIFDF